MGLHKIRDLCGFELNPLMADRQTPVFSNSLFASLCCEATHGNLGPADTLLTACPPAAEIFP